MSAGAKSSFVRPGGLVVPADRWAEQIAFAELALKALKDALASLDGLIGACDARVFHLPAVRDDGEVSPGVTPAELRHIPVNAMTGAAAIRLTKAIYQQIVRRHRQPPTRPDRLPGVMMASRLAVIEAAQAVNRAKDDLKSAMSALPRVSGRNSTLLDGTDLQHLMLLQAYRHIDVLPGMPDQISFCWTHRSCAVRQMTREQAMDLVDGMSAGLEDGATTRWMAALRAIDDDVVAQVKYIPPTPVCNVRVTGPDGKPAWSRRPSCTMPLLVPGTHLPRLRALETFDADQIDLATRGPDGTSVNNTRTDSALNPEPLIAGINLYRYKPECLEAALNRRAERQGAHPARLSTDRAHPFD